MGPEIMCMAEWKWFVLGVGLALFGLAAGYLFGYTGGYCKAVDEWARDEPTGIEK